MQFHSIGIASDHAGAALKELIAQALAEIGGLRLEDFGVATPAPTRVDYVDYAAKLAEAVSRGHIEGGIAICGTGIGMAITANKFRGVRAVSAWDESSCRLGREHNNSNVLCLGARALPPQEALALSRLWLQTPFSGGRYAERLNKIAALEAAWGADSSP